MKKLIFLICFTVVSSNIFAQLRMDENFSYPVGDSLGDHSWTSFSGGATNRLLVTTPGLTYAGYPLSGIGEATTATTTGQDAYKQMTSSADTSNANAVYASFMINVSSTQRPGDYFLALLPSNSTTFYSGRVFARFNSTALEFGLTKASTQDTNTMIWATGYSLNTTYLVVLKYKFVSGPSNDEVSLFVFSSGLPAVEPAVPTIGPMSFSTTSGDANNIGRIAIRQGTANRGSTSIIDGIRVSTSWFSTVLEVKYAVQGITNPGTSMLNVADSATVYVRNSASPYAVVETSYGVIDPSTLNVLFPLSNSLNGSYILEIAYRHSAEFRNGINIWSSANQNIATYNAGTYDFTSAASQAFGDNQIQVGTVFTAYNGDVNQDEIIDAGDLASTENAVGEGLSGYTNNDVTGDDFVDAGDLAQVENNVGLGVGTIYP